MTPPSGGVLGVAEVLHAQHAIAARRYIRAIASDSFIGDISDILLLGMAAWDARVDHPRLTRKAFIEAAEDEGYNSHTAAKAWSREMRKWGWGDEPALRSAAEAARAGEGK